LAAVTKNASALQFAAESLRADWEIRSAKGSGGKGKGKGTPSSSSKGQSGKGNGCSARHNGKGGKEPSSPM